MGMGLDMGMGMVRVIQLTFMGQYRSVNGRMERQIKRQQDRDCQMVHFPNGKCSIIRECSEIGHAVWISRMCSCNWVENRFASPCFLIKSSKQIIKEKGISQLWHIFFVLLLCNICGTNSFKNALFNT